MFLFIMTRRYGLLCGPTSKKKLIKLFWCPVVTLVTFSCNLNSFEKKYIYIYFKKFPKKNI